MSVVRDAIAEQVAALEREVGLPTAPFGYGSDLSCVSDLTETMDEVDGFSARALGEAIARRLDCPRGALPDDDNYGIDLRGMCNRATTDAEIQALGRSIHAEVLKDDRVDVVSVRVVPSSDASTLAVTLQVTPVDSASSFTLTLAASDSGVLLSEMKELA